MTPIFGKLVGHGISSFSASGATVELDEILLAWRNQSPNAQPAPYLILDVHHEKARVDCIVCDLAVLIAVDVQKDGKRTVLGVSVALGQA